MKIFEQVTDELYSKVDYLHCTDDGEASEQPHRASDVPNNVSKLNSSVLSDVVEGCCIKKDFNIS